MTTLRDQLERGYGMRAQRMTEGLLLASSFIFDDVRPTYVVLAMLALQVVSPFACPVALLWTAIQRRVPADRLGNLYYDMAGSRGAAAISSVVLTIALLLIKWGHPAVGRVLIGAPCASCILAATVGFCAGCAHYAYGRDLLVRAGLMRGTPEGACDVDVERR
jgi:uncharacterized protein DUF4395